MSQMQLRAPLATFGQTIRAYRLGFRWDSIHGGMLQIRDVGENCWELTLCPSDQIPAGRGSAKKSFHRCWWENEDVKSFLEDIAALRGVKVVHKLIVFHVNELGEQID